MNERSGAAAHEMRCADDVGACLFSLICDQVERRRGSSVHKDGGETEARRAGRGSRREEATGRVRAASARGCQRHQLASRACICAARHVFARQGQQEQHSHLSSIFLNGVKELAEGAVGVSAFCPIKFSNVSGLVPLL